MEIPFTNGFYVSDSLPLSNQECVNFFVNALEVEGLSQRQLFGSPGIEQLTTTGLVENRNRGSWVKNGIGYFVNGETLYSLDRTINDDGTQEFTTTSLGSVSGTARVSMADNGTQLMILVPGGNGYIYNEDAGTPFQQITDADFTANGNPQFVIYADSSFIVSTDTKKWIISDVNDGMSWNALNFGTAESDPDNIVAPVKVSNQVYITGSVTTEGFQNQPSGSGFPYIRNNVFLDVGCSAPYSIINANQTFYMVGKGKNESYAIWEFAGSKYNKISTAAIDNVLSGYNDEQIEDIFGFFYGIKGNYFLCFSFPDRTFEFNLVTRLWNERKSVIDGVEARWRCSSILQVYGKNIVFDLIDGRVGELSDSIYGEYSDEIISYFSTQPFYNQKGFLMPVIELTCESGVGNDDVSDPVVSLTISRNGKTYGREITRSLGKIGEYNKRQVWRRNGRCERLAVLKFRISDQVKKRIYRLEIL